MWFQEMSIFLPEKGLEIPQAGRSLKRHMLRKCMEHNWNYQRGGVHGGVRKHPFSGGDIDNIQNYIQ